MLLGSPPDMVRGFLLRKTEPSTLLTTVRQHIEYPGAGLHPRYSGLRVQGTAGSPTSTAPGDIICHFTKFSKRDFTNFKFVV